MRVIVFDPQANVVKNVLTNAKTFGELVKELNLAPDMYKYIGNSAEGRLSFDLNSTKLPNVEELEIYMFTKKNMSGKSETDLQTLVDKYGMPKEQVAAIARLIGNALVEKIQELETSGLVDAKAGVRERISAALQDMYA